MYYARGGHRYLFHSFPDAKMAVVTGANKGIGFAVVQALLQHPYDGVVYLTARDVGRGQEAVQELEKLGLQPRFHPLDITSPESISVFRDYIKTTYGGLDVLVSNAAVLSRQDAVLDHYAIDREQDKLQQYGMQAEEIISNNYFGSLKLWEELFPLLRPGARVSVVSSVLGHLSKIPGEELRKQLAADDLTKDALSNLMKTFLKQAYEGTHAVAGWPNSTYTVSKVGLSALTRIMQRHFDRHRPNDDILINCCHPGYVITDMTSNTGFLTPEQGAVAPTYLAVLPQGAGNKNNPRGEYVWADKQIVDWVNGPLPAEY